MDRTFILLGGGGHAAIVADLIGSNDQLVHGILDPSLEMDEERFGLRVLGDDSWLDAASGEQYVLANGIGQLPGGAIRAKLYEKFNAAGYEFPPLIHPSSVVSENSNLASGVQLMAGTVIQAGVVIKENTIVNTSASVDHDVCIGAHCHIAPGVTVCGDVLIHENVFIGSGATVIQGVEIGEGSIVGAGSVVTRSVPEQTRVLPARSLESPIEHG